MLPSVDAHFAKKFLARTHFASKLLLLPRMETLTHLWRGLVGITAFIIYDTPIDAVSPGLILLGGCIVVLLAGVWRTARSA